MLAARMPQEIGHPDLPEPSPRSLNVDISSHVEQLADEFLLSLNSSPKKATAPSKFYIEAVQVVACKTVESRINEAETPDLPLAIETFDNLD
jgi:CRISPR/Cas system endoribonuclease Cas6 (RAMP superfamily)